MRDGGEHRAEVTTNRGDTEDPYSPDEVVAKFHDMADPVWGVATTRRVRDAVMGLGASSGLEKLEQLLVESDR